MPPHDEAKVLRAKYHDWCSARVADRFLALTPEQIYAIAHGGSESEVVGDGEARAAGPAAGAAGGRVSAELSYPELVERVRADLSRELGLPEFEDWLRDYRHDPKRYDAELIGFWRAGTDG